MKVNLQGIQKIKQARSRLVLSQIFFGSITITMKCKEDNTWPTMATDGKTLFYNLDFVNCLSLAQLEMGLAHEALHAIMLHSLRILGREGFMWNQACDYVVNGVLKRAGFQLLKGMLWDNAWSGGGMNAEQVYNELLKDKAKQKSKQEDKNSDAPGQPGNDPGNDSNGNGNSPGDNADKNSGAPGNFDPNSDWNIGNVVAPTKPDGKPLSESELSQLKNELKTIAVKALNTAKGCGNVPAGMDRIIEEIVVERRDIEEYIRNFIQKVYGGDYSWKKPNKTYITRDLYVPSSMSDFVPDIVMVLDTSGSVDQTQVNYFAAKVNSVLEEYNTTVHLIYCDTKAYYEGAFSQGDLPLQLQAKGGGGTDFQPPFKLVEEMGIDPACLIYLTDLECHRFPDDPGYPVLWAVYSNYNRGREWEMPFGDVMDVNPKEE